MGKPSQSACRETSPSVVMTEEEFLVFKDKFLCLSLSLGFCDMPDYTANTHIQMNPK